jgi:hypothetical protein
MSGFPADEKVIHVGEHRPQAHPPESIDIIVIGSDLRAVKDLGAFFVV